MSEDEIVIVPGLVMLIPAVPFGSETRSVRVEILYVFDVVREKVWFVSLTEIWMGRLEFDPDAWDHSPTIHVAVLPAIFSV